MTKITRTSDHVYGDCASGHALPGKGAIWVEDCHLLPGINLRGAMAKTKQGDWSIMLEVEAPGGAGLYVMMTPEGARMMAEKFISMAHDVDQLIAEQANDAIKRARSGGAQ